MGVCGHRPTGRGRPAGEWGRRAGRRSRARVSWHGGDLQVETGPAGRDDARGRFVRRCVHGRMDDGSDGSWVEMDPCETTTT